MFDYLVQREHDEMFRTSIRELEFPDGTRRKVEAFRLVWAWFDRSLNYEFGRDQMSLLTSTLDCAEEEKVDLGTALGKVLNRSVQNIENWGGDFTDDNIALEAQRRHAKKLGGFG